MAAISDEVNRPLDALFEPPSLLDQLEHIGRLLDSVTHRMSPGTARLFRFSIKAD